MTTPAPEDPVAAKTEWTPLVPGGANFITGHLVEEGPSRFAMRPTAALKLFGQVLLLAGLGCITAGPLTEVPFMIVFGLPLVGFGVAGLRHRISVFDGQARCFLGKKKQVVPFDSIYALQLLPERVSDESDFDSYELNLVLSHGERINVIDHSGLKEVRGDAQKLSALIGCKVWEATP